MKSLKWFTGPQSDVAPWFSTQEHGVEPSIKSVAELERNLRKLEGLALSRSTSNPRKTQESESKSFIDTVVISHEFTDHCHRATLEEIHPSVPVFATEKAAELIRSFNHFQTVVTTPTFGPETSDWRKVSKPPLPKWLSIARVVTDGDGLYYHSAIMMTFNLGYSFKPKSDAAESVFYAPHGIKAEDLEHISKATPRVETLAMLHGLHDVGILMTKQLNLGAYNGLQAVRICRAKYWIATHDEVKKGHGLISPFLRRDRLTVQQALEREGLAGKDREPGPSYGDIQFADLGSGESMLLQ